MTETTKITNKNFTSILNVGDDIEVHRDVNDYLDDTYGLQYPEKNGRNYTGKYRRKGEGKFFKKILRYHEKQAKRYAQQMQFNDSVIYVFAFEHNGDTSQFATIATFNWWLNSFRVFPSKDIVSEVQSYIDAIAASMKAREVYHPICLITNSSEHFDDIPVVSEIYS